MVRAAVIRPGFFIAIFIFVLITTACLGSDSVPKEFVTPDIHSLQLRTFEALWETVNDNYLYDDFQGTDWESVRESHLNRLDEEVTPEEFTIIAEEMLAQLPSGSSRLLNREERIERAVADISTFEGIGVFVAARHDPERRMLILSVMPGSPAQAVGIEALVRGMNQNRAPNWASINDMANNSWTPRFNSPRKIFSRTGSDQI